MTIEICCIKVDTQVSQTSLCATTWISVDQTGMKAKTLPIILTIINIFTLGVSWNSHHHHLHNIYHHCLAAEMTMDSQRGSLLKPQRNLKNINTCLKMRGNSLCCRKWKLYTGSFQFKNMVLSVFKGNVYSHIWNNRNKNHVSLNLDELAYILKNKTVIQDIMEQLLMPNVEKKIPNFPFEMQKNGNYALDLSGDKKMVLSLFKGNVYCHIWSNKNKKHISLNSDELMYILSNEADIHYMTELLSKWNSKL